MCQACRLAETHRGGAATFLPHGMKVYRTEHAPMNKTPEHVEQRVLEHFHTRTAVMPESLNGNIYRKCLFEGDGADTRKVSTVPQCWFQRF